MTLTVRSVILLGLLFWNPVIWNPVSAQETESTSTLEACLTLNETDIRSDINTLSQRFFEAELNAVDLTRIVDRKWFELGMPKLPRLLGDEQV